MARKGKWVSVVSPQEPVVEAARRALGDRLDLVWHYLRQASRAMPSDTVHVHQLRVSTRRAVAAIKLFAPLLPERRREWMLRRLKRIRRAAGAARDLDVMIERLAALARKEDREGAYAVLLAHLRECRHQAQQPIDVISRRLAKRAFRKRAKQLVRRIRLRTEEERAAAPTFAEAARVALEPRVQRFFQTGEVEFSDDTLLHAFRIQGKQLRYTMEVFAGAFDPVFKRELYPLVAGLQDRLGEINDHATASARFVAWAAAPDCSDGLRPLLESLANREQQSLEQCRTAFIEWWTPARREDLRQRFATTCGWNEGVPTA